MRESTRHQQSSTRHNLHIPLCKGLRSSRLPKASIHCDNVPKRLSSKAGHILKQGPCEFQLANQAMLTKTRRHEDLPPSVPGAARRPHIGD